MVRIICTHVSYFRLNVSREFLCASCIAVVYSRNRTFVYILLYKALKASFSFEVVSYLNILLALFISVSDAHSANSL